MTRPPSPGPSDLAVVSAVAVASIVLGLLWLWGALAGAVFGQGWTAAPAARLPAVLAALPGHLGDPSAAWPPSVRGRLPSAPGFYAALALVAAAIGVGGGVLLRGVGPWLRARRPGARWAGRSDLAPLSRGPFNGRRLRAAGHPERDPGARLALGRHRRRLLYAEQRHALVAFGPPQSGKSAGLAVPALLEWEGPAVASSIKTDLLGVTLARRRSMGPAFVYDPFGLAGVRAHTWSPLGAATTWDGALEVAWRLACAGEVDQRGVEGGDFWAIAAEQRLAPLLFTAARTGAGVDTLVRWAYGQGSRDLHASLAQLAGEATDERQLADAHSAFDAVRAFEAQADRTRSSIEATTQALLRAYRFTRVARSAETCEITADRLLDERATLYLIGDAKASKLLRPIFLALLSEVVDRAYERATLNGGRLALPLLLCLDEAGNVAPLPNLAEVASTAPSHNIQLVSIFHDLQQARARFGKQAETVVNSHRARMLLPGVADLETLRYFASLIGEEEVRDLTRTTGSGTSTRSVSLRRRPLSGPEALRQLPERHALLLYGRLPPARMRLRMWFEDRRLRRLRGDR